MFHAGGEGSSFRFVKDAEDRFLGANRGNVVAFSKMAIDCGADLVVGSGPHVLRATDTYKGKPIAYSLGNAFTPSGISVAGKAGLAMVFQVEFDDATLQPVSAKSIGFKQARGKVPVLSSEADEEVAYLSKVWNTRNVAVEQESPKSSPLEQARKIDSLPN